MLVMNEPGLASALSLRMPMRSAATRAAVWSARPNQNTLAMPYSASSSPLSMGPSTRVPLLVAASIDSAEPTRSTPTASPIIMRRTGWSDAQPMPFTKLATARCQTAIAPRLARIASVSVTVIDVATTRASTRRRSSRSAAAPISAPNRLSGSMRSMVSIATTNAEPVS